MAFFGEVNPDLMSSSCLQAALHKGEVVAEVLEWLHVGHGFFAVVAFGRSATPVAAITHELAADRPGSDAANADGDVAAMGAVQAKLLRQDPARGNAASKHKQPARLTVDAVHGPNRPHPWRFAFPRPLPTLPAAASECAGDHAWQHLVECGLQLSATGWPGEFLVMPGRRQAARLFDDGHRVIEIDDVYIFSLRWGGGRTRQDFDDFPSLEPASLVVADVAVDHDPPATDEFSSGCPAQGRLAAAEEGSHSAASVCRRHPVDFGGIWTLVAGGF